MTLWRLVLRNVLGSLFRSGAILACAALVAGLSLSATLVVREAEGGLRRNLSRMGADIQVIPWGTMAPEFDGAHLIGMMTQRWMPRAFLERIARVEGVEALTPQLYLSTLTPPGSPDAGGSSASAASDSYGAGASSDADSFGALGRSVTDLSKVEDSGAVYLVAYDPATDFVLQPWLEHDPLGTLRLGEAVAGVDVLDAENDGKLQAYGYPLKLVRRLQETGSDVDRALFVSFDTAQAILEEVQRQAKPAFELAPESISSAMVKVKLGSDPHEVAVRIMEQVPGVVPLESTGFFQTQRTQMVGLLRTVLVLAAVTWLMSMLFVGLVSTLAANERRREMGTLRALGATSGVIMRTLLLEGVTLAVTGGLVGIGLAIVVVGLFGQEIALTTGILIALPSPLFLAGMAAAGLALAVASVTVASWLPARNLSREEPALSMRE
ncbi:MAG TPA: FtsX-like permease family protein [Anaerolineae bacterium]|nr:FtsX-like permease family protein [Anaerolineae bacterium]